MNIQRPQTSVDRLRDAVALRVQATSLRSVARQVGMSPSGLDKFLSGGTPYAKSRRKLFDWLQRERSNLPSGLAADGMAAALGSLVRDLAPERREPALYALIDTLRGLYSTHAESCPPWLSELARNTEEGTAFHQDDVPRTAVLDDDDEGGDGEEDDEE
ncbi:MAG TPA: hypothetical protein VF665_14695 [Longimicrobium sp.]|jgi:lambda repressor-like predicted transcriptional regulator|uniref:hypothetical protein n=1 Tax=Longimicrobium sp. TaxID=2029185 RepID=UPI002ED7B6F4